MSSDERTAAKQAVIDEVADDRGEEWALTTIMYRN